MKKLLAAFLLLTVFALAACGNDVYEADTAELAVQNLQKDFIKEESDLQLAPISETEQLGIFKGVISGEPEVFVTYVQLVDGKWRVMEAVAVGHEDKEDLEPAKGKYIEGEIIDAKDNSTEVKQDGDKYIFNLASSDKAVTVKLK